MWNQLCQIVKLYYSAQIDELTIEAPLARFLRAALEEDRAQFVKRFGEELAAELEARGD